MKRWKKIVGGTLVVLAAAGAGAAWHFQNELQAVNYYLRYSQEEQAALEQENEAMLENVLQQANLPAEIFTDSSLTTEEIAQKLEALAQEQSSAMDAGDRKDGVYTQNAETVGSVENHPSNSSSSINTTSQNYDAELAAMVGEIYALRASFIGQLDGLLQQAKAEYSALSPEQREKQKSSLTSKYIGLAGNLESSCDSQMESILSRIQKHLKETGGDTSLVKEIRKVYENEKALKKSYYMSMMS